LLKRGCLYGEGLSALYVTPAIAKTTRTPIMIFDAIGTPFLVDINLEIKWYHNVKNIALSKVHLQIRGV